MDADPQIFLWINFVCACHFKFYKKFDKFNFDCLGKNIKISPSKCCAIQYMISRI